MTEPLVARLRGVLFLSLIDDMQAIVDEAATELARLQAENEALRRERDEARANSVSRGKKLLRFRAKIIEISDNIEHEGDRAYFGSTNHADELREIFLWLDSFKWDRVMSESDDDDLLSSIENAVARANAAEAAREAAEAKAARLEEALKQAEVWLSNMGYNVYGVLVKDDMPDHEPVLQAARAALEAK